MNVAVVRNENSPVFFNDTYEVTIRQDVPSGTQIASVNARDLDTAVSTNHVVLRALTHSLLQTRTCCWNPHTRSHRHYS